MADAMPTKRKRKAEEKPHDGKKKKQKKSGKPAERAPVQEPATGKLGDIFEAMRNSSAISEVTTAEMFDSVLAALGNHCLEFGVSATDALPLPKHICVYATDGSGVSNSDRCIHHQHAFFLGTPVSDELLPEFLKQLVYRCPQLGTVDQLLEEFKSRSSNMLQRLVEAPLHEGSVSRLTAAGFTQVAPEVMLSCQEVGVSGHMWARLDARPTGAAERNSASATSSTLREDDAWTLTVVLTWNGLQALLELFEKQTRDKHGGVFEPIHAWPALAGQSEEKDAIRKSLSELSKQYIGASLLIKAEEDGGASSNREAAIRAVDGRKQGGRKASANLDISADALWTKKSLIASVAPARLQDILRRLGRGDLFANPMPSYLQIAQALAKTQRQNSSTA